MTFKPALWQPIAIGLSAINLVAAGFAAGAAEPWHASVHVGLALALGLWARRMHRGEEETPDQRLEALEVEANALRRELSEAQERLDFTERVLAQAQEPRRVDPERQG